MNKKSQEKKIIYCILLRLTHRRRAVSQAIEILLEIYMAGNTSTVREVTFKKWAFVLITIFNKQNYKERECINAYDNKIVNNRKQWLMKEFKYSVMVLLLKEIDATWIEGIMTETQCFYYSITCPNTHRCVRKHILGAQFYNVPDVHAQQYYMPDFAGTHIVILGGLKIYCFIRHKAFFNNISLVVSGGI